MIEAHKVTVTSSGDLLAEAGASAATGRDEVLVRNTGSVTVYLGGAAVSTAQGYTLAAGEVVGLRLLAGDDLYGCVAAESQGEVRVLQTRAEV